jgi:ferritin-like metal-binding protein YciE
MDTTKDSKNMDTVQQYVGDMLALESHIEAAMDGQLKEVTRHARAKELVNRFHGMVKTHREAMRAHLDEIGGSEPSPIKEAIADFFGKAAGMIDNMRSKGEAKALRDDYTAFNHAAVSYAMLHATAHALGAMSTMQIADRHLRDYARAAQDINQVIADVVVYELRDEGLAIQEGTAEHCTEAINKAWRDTTPHQTGAGGTSAAMRQAA